MKDLSVHLMKWMIVSVVRQTDSTRGLEQRDSSIDLDHLASGLGGSLDRMVPSNSAWTKNNLKFLGSSPSHAERPYVR